MKKKLLFISGRFFISSIELIFIIITQYLYACDISYYPIMSFIFQHNLFLFRRMFLRTSQVYLVFLYCQCIVMRNTLFQTFQ